MLKDIYQLMNEDLHSSMNDSMQKEGSRMPEVQQIWTNSGLNHKINLIPNQSHI